MGLGLGEAESFTVVDFEKEEIERLREWEREWACLGTPTGPDDGSPRPSLNESNWASSVSSGAGEKPVAYPVLCGGVGHDKESWPRSGCSGKGLEAPADGGDGGGSRQTNFQRPSPISHPK